MNEIILITGANAGLGKDAARQLAENPDTKKIYLACRNETKAKSAKAELELITGRNIFEIMIVDVSKPNSVRSAIANLEEPIDALIMNAGGMGGKKPGELTVDGVSTIFAANVLGHVIMVDELLKADKLKHVAMYASSEGVRGVKKMGIKKPEFKSHSVEEFISIFNGSNFVEKVNGNTLYAYIKYAATLWMSAMARKHPAVRFISMSPGATSGTEVTNNLPLFEKIMYKYIGFPILMPLMGMVHKLEKGAQRYVKAITDESLISGKFYASSDNKLTGPVTDQSNISPDLVNETYQDNAYEAIHRFAA
ncbi:SDR family NAD(P)-dependent oxidoreductase [bacterium]|nr:SDR family NAD(P)-dependent oxidoreductase [bacterium]